MRRLLSSRNLRRQRLLLPSSRLAETERGNRRRLILLLPSGRLTQTKRNGRRRPILLLPSSRLTERLAGRGGCGRSRLLILPETICIRSSRSRLLILPESVHETVRSGSRLLILPESVHETICSGIGSRLLMLPETIPERNRLMLMLLLSGDGNRTRPLKGRLRKAIGRLLIEPIHIGSSMSRMLILLLKMIRRLLQLGWKMESRRLLPGLTSQITPYECCFC